MPIDNTCTDPGKLQSGCHIKYCSLAKHDNGIPFLDILCQLFLQGYRLCFQHQLCFSFMVNHFISIITFFYDPFQDHFRILAGTDMDQRTPDPKNRLDPVTSPEIILDHLSLINHCHIIFIIHCQHFYCL